ncbi:MAG: hypothetical protein U9O94_01710 [Nanoarchaeota archaeon]|nr:hypothetical protein [Nanoarchaeota archaeon]
MRGNNIIYWSMFLAALAGSADNCNSKVEKNIDPTPVEEKIRSNDSVKEKLYEVRLGNDDYIVETLRYAHEDSIHILIRSAEDRENQKNIITKEGELPFLTYHKRYGLPNVEAVEHMVDGTLVKFLLIETLGPRFLDGFVKNIEPEVPTTTLLRYANKEFYLEERWLH